MKVVSVKEEDRCRSKR